MDRKVTVEVGGDIDGDIAGKRLRRHREDQRNDNDRISGPMLVSMT
jgi:hypothetical protein